ncbi:MAG: glutamate dehydrogenase [Candidatus Magasanikbacteria bacterium CG_4_10_14_0_2_um_filter_37_12]|uniref:Glutamate dehydrogenase n=1 Tax=Candidatus Magasanikbacteria bacterium CG_4_10_14_0_2_um_filter_37_12 TaxID=1974637 RepID=A0A2M7V6Q6_9BACT|nr:MAG: glutamate dehydrogenase [Candidatus Magasanikbacteria bacterium CG_4_10_14_0_2_um_filter_37_12]
MNQFENAMKQLDNASKIINLNSDVHEILKSPERVLTVSIPVKMDNGSTKVFTGFRSQYNNALGPYKGGIRYHWNVSLEEVKALSFWMMVKCATVNIPMGGGKGGIIVNPKELSEGEIERLSRGYIEKIWRDIGSDKDIPAPDVYTTPQIMAWMRDEYEKLVGHSDPGVITGKPIEQGGSEGRGFSTAQGGAYCTRELATKLGLVPSETTVAIQGFGNAGSFMAKILAEMGYKIVAVSDSKGGIKSDDGLDISALTVYKEKTGSVVGFGSTEAISNEEILELAVDILVPAALENVITAENVGNIRAKSIVELANGPTTPEADEILKEKGIIVVPDVLANAGGVTVSYFEWDQNIKGEHWSEVDILEKLEKIIVDAFHEVWETKEKYNIDMRTAAFVKAIERVASKMEI